MLPSMTASATLRMVRRRSIEVFWIQRKASGSVSPCSAINSPLARSSSLRTSSRPRVPISFVKRLDLVEAADRHLDGGHQVGLGERLHQVGHRARVPGPLHQLALGEGGQDKDRRDPLGGDPLGGRDPVEDRHLHVEDGQVRASSCRAQRPTRRRRPRPRPGSPLFEHLLQVEADQGLVLGDHDTQRVLAHAHERTVIR